MIIRYHKLYMERLADIYLTKYGMLGYEEASKWFDNFLDKGLRYRIKPYISALAEGRNLEID